MKGKNLILSSLWQQDHHDHVLLSPLFLTGDRYVPSATASHSNIYEEREEKKRGGFSDLERFVPLTGTLSFFLCRVGFGHQRQKKKRSRTDTHIWKR